MFVFEYITVLDAMAGVAGTLAILALMIKARGIAGWLDPLTQPLFQVVLTLLLLGLRIIPPADVFVCVLFLLTLSLCRGRPPKISVRTNQAWRRAVAVLLPLSLAANAYLFSQKGILLFQDDVGTARQEFYQGWGMFLRLNGICAVLFAVRWAEDLLAGRAMRWASMALLAWTSYLVLTLGSKSGLLLILTCVGAATIYSRTVISTRTLITLCVGVALSVALMFTIVYPEEALARFGIRMISYVDGPFYFFQLSNPPTATLGYSFDQLLVALRVYDKLPQSGLGQAINLDYLSYDNELVGPNPQIFVEARAIAGFLWPLYYAVIAGLIVLTVRKTRTAYSYALLMTFAGPLLIDSQFALSNLLNITLAFLLKAGLSSIPRVRRTHVLPPPSPHLPRVQ